MCVLGRAGSRVRAVVIGGGGRGGGSGETAGCKGGRIRNVGQIDGLGL